VVGPLIATAMVAAVADGKVFRNGRQFAAWLALIPYQHSSGDKQRLLGITKLGDPYLRMPLVHGARSLVYRSAGKTGSPESVDYGKATETGNNEGVCGGGQQKRADHLGASGQR
jgi:Transposase IS116/IS110/IS902 family